MNEKKTILICPVCQNALYRHDRFLCCLNQHTFDKSRQGYINLLLSNQKKSSDPGDSKEMVKSRLEFLKGQFYHPLVTLLSEKIAKSLPFSKSCTIADLGCGVGYYLDGLKDNFADVHPNLNYFGIDISKEAIHCASTQSKSIQWIVGSNKHLPFEDKSIDVGLSVFSPWYIEEVHRILTPQGTFFVMTPNSQHLIELRETLFDEIKPIDDSKILEKSKNFFDIHSSIPFSFTIHLKSSCDIENLLKMTPYYWRCLPHKKMLLLSKQELKLTVDVILWILTLPQ